MFVIELTYKAELSAIDAAMKPHMAWLQRHYAAGTFIASGRKVPRDGGIILATGDDRATIEALVREDPFVARGLADVRVIEFRTSQRADDFPARFA
ncbi:MAG TPA: YciI family protein [Kofleriaceae bacterium]|nr:YciI family protein [Kofleriaceae bacterium]